MRSSFSLSIASCVLVVTSVLSTTRLGAQDEPSFDRERDVIYGRKSGVALTLDVLTPREPNGAGVLWIVSGGWFSSHEAISPGFVAPLLRRGYTVFAVVHGSQPKFTITEIVDDIHRAARFVRHHAERFGIDPERLGVTGASAGGHLSLMLATGGGDGDPTGTDPVERASSRVQAVACFFPPTDFLNYGKEGENAMGRGILQDFRAAFDFKRFERETKAFERIVDEEKLAELGRAISPFTQAGEGDAPCLIVHGDEDKLVPLQQAEIIIERLDEAGVATELVIKKGAKHGWPTIMEDVENHIARWFDTHLLPAKE